MAKPVIAVVGRPNVGKSMFFNYVAGKRISIVEDTPGVTRDRVYSEGEWLGKSFILIDTGGIEINSKDKIKRMMHDQARIAIETSDVIIHMVDVKDGVTALDLDVANILKKSGKPVVVAVNKVDNIGRTPNDVYEFYNLGLGEIFPISSIHGLGIGDLLDEVYKHILWDKKEQSDEEAIKVAIIGKPNSGKSSLINKILGEERVIVSDIPGTTRDAIDTSAQIGDDKYIFIDTAGLRRKSKVYDKIEKYSNLRSWTAVDRADVCVIMIDAKDGVVEQDTKIAGYAHEQGKGIIIAVNKWDLIEKETGTLEGYKNKVIEKLAFMQYAPIIFISAKTGQRINKLYDLIKEVNKFNSMRISTGVLNDVLNEAVAIVQPPSDKGKRLKIYYTVQAQVKPPTFVLFVNRMDLMHYSYQRYIENQIREAFLFKGTPIRFKLREREKE